MRSRLNVAAGMILECVLGKEGMEKGYRCVCVAVVGG